MTAQERRTAAWLQKRGWSPSLMDPDLWYHEKISPAVGKTTATAVAMQTRHEREQAESARDRDIRRSDTDDEYRERALSAIRRVAEREHEFTTDAVLDEDPELAGTRSLGPAMLHASREGWVVSTDRMGKSSTKASHSRMKRLWKSLIVGGASPSPIPTMDLASVVRS